MPTGLNRYSTYYACSSGAESIAFGFDASTVTIVNGTSKPMYVAPGGNAATTMDFRLTTGETLTLNGIRCGQFALTVTGSDTGGYVRIGAWGG